MNNVLSLHLPPPQRQPWKVPLAALALLWMLAPRPAAAELVLLTDGHHLKVRAYELAGPEAMRLTLPSGGRLTLPMSRIERVIDDEVPLPEPAPEVVEPEVVIAPPVAIEVAFDESQPVPQAPYGELIHQTARRHRLNPQVVSALIQAESAYDRWALSRKGARGLMQLMPATAQRFGVQSSELWEPQRNLEAGARYLRWLLDRFDGDLLLALAGYNAGEGSVQRYGGVPPYRETRNYIRRIYRTLGLPAPTV